MTRIDMLLIAYATGSLGRYKSLLVITILVFNPKARRKLSLLEEVGGDLIMQQAPTEVSPETIDRIIKHIEEN